MEDCKAIIKRKCGYCNKVIQITESNLVEVLLYDDKFYHRACFERFCDEKLQQPRARKKKWCNAKETVNDLSDTARLNLIPLFKKAKLFQFVFDAYDVSVVSKSVYEKVANILNGSYVGLKNGIPIDDLLDMWIQKISFLNKLADTNRTKNKVMTTDQRINYDLSVLVNKYDSYLGWKRQQEILAIESGTKRKIVSTEFYSIKQTNNKEKCDDDSDMESLVEDIFG